MSTQFPGGDENEATRMFRPRAIASHPPMRELPAMDLREIGALAAANPLLAAANPLLMMLQTLRAASPPGNVVELRNKLIESVKEFDAACSRQNVPELERNIANYALCSVIDECVQMTPWGGSSNWAQQSLLLHFHRDTWGGEKFFEILNRIAATPAKFQSLLELFYVCLALGFMGRFHLEGPSGKQAVSDLREKVYQMIRHGRPEADRTLSSRWTGLEVAARRFRGFGLVGALSGVLAMFCLGLFTAYWWGLGSGVDALQLERLAVTKVPKTAVITAPAAKPRLAHLLAPEITGKQIELRESRLESVVTLLGEQLFGSGSAVPATSASALIDKVSEALKQVEGKVVVTGHTDNVPTRTLRFSSNWELSKERAASVARIVSGRLRDPTRVSSEGRGDTEPVAANDSEAGRAQNRRVEIVLKAADGFQ